MIIEITRLYSLDTPYSIYFRMAVEIDASASPCDHSIIKGVHHGILRHPLLYHPILKFLMGVV